MALIEEYADKQEMAPCPWCGGLPNEITRNLWNSISAGFSFICPTVGDAVRPQTEFYKDRDRAKDAWNGCKERVIFCVKHEGGGADEVVQPGE